MITLHLSTYAQIFLKSDLKSPDDKIQSVSSPRKSKLIYSNWPKFFDMSK